MAKTKVDIEVDFEKRKDQATKAIDTLLKEFGLGLKIQWNNNGPFLAIVDAKQYEEKPVKAAKK